MRLAWIVLVCGAVAGCGRGMDMSGDQPDMYREIPDGHLQIGCVMPNDCDDNNPCTVEGCQVGACTHTKMDCSTAVMNDPACNSGVCVPQMGKGVCMSMNANEGGDCMTSASTPGKCLMGVCQMIPQCQVSGASFGNPPTVYACNQTSSDDTSNYQDVISDYGTCATGENGPELAYLFQSPNDRTVTVTLTSSTLGDAGTTGLDLIVLQGMNCMSSATCLTSSTMANTPGSVTFMAKATMPYLVVVDGRNNAKGPFTINFGCSPLCTSKGALTCNMTTTGNTAGGSSNVSTVCGGNDPGPENAFTISPKLDTIYSLKLSGLSAPLDLVAVQATTPTAPDCDGTTCMGMPMFPTTTADRTLSFTGLSNSVYEVVVDSQMAAGGPYSLALSCVSSCAQGASGFGIDPVITCTSPSDSRQNDDSAASTKAISSWGPAASPCATGETGPEVVYQFQPLANGMYTFTLTGLTKDLDLIVIQGDSLNCDPSTACIAQSLKRGTTNESVTFMADMTKVYYIAVDGYMGAVSPFTLKLTSMACPGPDCSNTAGNNSYLGCSYLEDFRASNDPVHSTNKIDSWKCDANTTGPEVVYTFTPPAMGTYTVTLDGLSANLDLIVETQSTVSFTCDPTQACTAQSTKTGTASESLNFMGDPSKTYYIAVDGVNLAVSNFHIKISSPACPAPICQDNFSFNDLSCFTMSTSSRNDGSGSTSDVTTWGKSTMPALYDTGLTGPELLHMFTPSTSGTYQFEMIGLHANLDLIAIQADATGACSPGDTVVAVSKNPGTMEETVSFAATSGTTYYLVADGQAGAISTYTMAITSGCP